MKLTVDAAALGALSAPLRRSVAVAHEMRLRTGELAAHADYAGDPVLAAAVRDFVHAWGTGLAATADHGDTLARMCEQAAASYHDLERRASAPAGTQA